MSGRVTAGTSHGRTLNRRTGQRDGRLGRPTALLLAVVSCAVAALAACREPPRQPNGRPVVLVVVDTLRADVLQVYGDRRPTSPELLRRASRAAVFDRALAPSPWTLPSFGSLLTGRYPQFHGAGVSRVPSADGGKKRFSGLAASVPSLAEILAAQGYPTAAFITNSFLDPKFGLDRGFATYDQTYNRFLDERRADVLVERALGWIDTHRESPFFLMLQLLDPHLPYDPPEPYRGRFTSGYSGPLTLPFAPRFNRLSRLRSGLWELNTADRTFLAGAYAEQVPYVDAQLGRLLAALEQRQLLERAVVLVTADHGEELFDHDSFEHGHTLYQELLHVPLLIWGPGVRPGRLATAVSLVDVMPTLLEAVGLPQTAASDGVSLWPALTRRGEPPRRTLFAQAPLYGPPREAAVDWPFKLLYGGHGRRPRLFDLDADPGETRNVAAGHRPQLQQLTSQLLEFLQAAKDAPVEPRGVELDERIEEDLRALGYVD